MESMVRKLQQRYYRRAKEEMRSWDELQSRLLSQFSNAASITNRLDILMDVNNYGVLRCVPGIQEALLAKQLQTRATIFNSMEQTLKEMHVVASSLDKIARDANQLFKGQSAPTSQQMQQRIGIMPSLADCLDGLRRINEMYQAEYKFKESVISALPSASSENDTNALHQLLADQPNIPPKEGRGSYGNSLIRRMAAYILSSPDPASTGHINRGVKLVEILECFEI